MVDVLISGNLRPFDIASRTGYNVYSGKRKQKYTIMNWMKLFLA